MAKQIQNDWQTQKRERVAYCLFFLGQNILWGYAGYVETFLTDIGIAAAAAAVQLKKNQNPLYLRVEDLTFRFDRYAVSGHSIPGYRQALCPGNPGLL